ncbi:hypothetical protein CSHISOI_11188 [Colletotrichum shisoi]|uniref:Uncharacterized protein n=1 Tax=Colletotrichum shisoi TaxID=2078593 RepID=A0A5Q4BC37_9PEZI|nr:hypothetical protein CSHISOI_11188 [Colletotrichum shisoi]
MFVGSRANAATRKWTTSSIACRGTTTQTRTAHASSP